MAEDRTERTKQARIIAKLEGYATRGAAGNEATSYDWRDRAACLGTNTEEFFPERQGRGIPDVMRLCWTECQVRLECLKWSCAAREEYGIWGGISPTERKGTKAGGHSPYSFERLSQVEMPKKYKNEGDQQ